MAAGLILILLEGSVTITGLAQALIPIVSVYHMFKFHDASRVLSFFFLISVLLGYYSFVYGLLIGSIPIICVYSLSFLFNFAYLECYITCSQGDKQSKAVLLILLLIGLSTFICLSYLALPFNPFAYEITSILFTFLLFIAPFQHVSSMIKEIDHTYIPFEIIIIMLLNCLTQIAYGISQQFSLQFLIANSIGCFVITSQILLWLYCYAKTKVKGNLTSNNYKDLEAEEAKKIVSEDKSRGSYQTVDDFDE